MSYILEMRGICKHFAGLKALDIPHGAGALDAAAAVIAAP